MDSSALKLRAQYRSFHLFQFEKCISRHFHFRIFVHCSPNDYVMRKVKFIQMRKFTHTPRNFNAVEKVLSVSYKIIYICILLLVWRGGDTERVVSEWVCVCVKSTGNSVFQRFCHSFHYYLQLCYTYLECHKSAMPLTCLYPSSFFLFLVTLSNEVSDARVRAHAPVCRKCESKVKHRSWDNIIK